MTEFMNVIVHIKNDNQTQVIATRKEDSFSNPKEIAQNYIKQYLDGELPEKEMIAMRKLPIEMTITNDPTWLCSEINKRATILYPESDDES